MPKRLLLVFGGRSSEHEVSVRSATEVLAAVDRDRFAPTLMAIDRHGRFRIGGDVPAQVAERGDEVSSVEAILRTHDVVFPLLHGPWGEDGTVQGLLEVFDVPYVGSGVLASALCMDKAAFKTFVAADPHGLPVTPGASFDLSTPEAVDAAHAHTLEAVGLPCFIKPANQGSSVGVSRAETADALRAGLELARRYDPKVIVETAIDDARELELAVLGNGGPETRVSGVGEIGLPDGTWYDYETKYENDVATLTIPAEVEAELLAQLQDVALRAFRATDCRGLARVDFLVDRASGRAYLNEVNTMPGFTSISMYPKLMGEAGVSYQDLISKLCELGIEAHASRAGLHTER
jgi:D-alanine-D-alanine ligase